jgi:hypothetical protein
MERGGGAKQKWEGGDVVIDSSDGDDGSFLSTRQQGDLAMTESHYTRKREGGVIASRSSVIAQQQQDNSTKMKKKNRMFPFSERERERLENEKKKK